ncbi:MAG: amidase [Acidobacteria bacterium]|nr:amidase [Acidobacteriota bacterium]
MPIDLTRRHFLTLSAALAAASCGEAPQSQPSPAAVGEFELDEATFDDLLRMQSSGERSAAELTRLYLERIEQIDRQGPALNSVIEINPEAEAIAEALDRERAEGRLRGPLHGLPLLIKDNIDTGDRMQTTAGSLALEGSHAKQDAAVAAALREAGAVLLGKTNLSEWANFRSFDSTSGWSGRGGLTRNPYALDHNTCGSSSGSGAGASANLCAGAIGTETNGSITCPSSINGLVGVKPTVGLVSQAGIIPISHSQDTAGPMTRTVRDAALLLGAIADRSVAQASADYAAALDAGALRGARIGVGRGFDGTGDLVRPLFEEALKALRAAGAELIEIETGLPREQAGRAPLDVLEFEFKDGLNRYLAGLDPSIAVRDLAGVIDFNKAHADRELVWFDQGILEESQEKGPLTEKAYLDAVALIQRLSRASIDGPISEHGIQTIVAPTTGPSWATDLVRGDPSSGGSSSAAAIAGYPNVTVPMGAVHGLPVGLSFFGPAWSEQTLLRLAYAFEQQTKARRKPGFRPTVQA